MFFVWPHSCRFPWRGWRLLSWGAQSVIYSK